VLNYDLGLHNLKYHLPPGKLDEYNIYEARLRENLRRDRLYGSTEMTRADRASILDSLNQFARENVGASFNDLCQPASAAAEASLQQAGRPTPAAASNLGPPPVEHSGASGIEDASDQVPVQVTLDFQVQDANVNIAWHAPLLGDRVTVFTPPYDEALLLLVIKALDAAQHPSHPAGGPQFSIDEKNTLAKHGLWQNERVSAGIHNIIGRALYNGLGPNGKSALDAVRNYSIDQRRPTSYVLRFPRNAIQLAALPWELIADQDQAILLSRGNDVDSCERYLNMERAIPPPLPGTYRPHLLALSPQYGIPDDVRHEERNARLKSWSRLRDAGTITFDEITPLAKRDLTDYLRNADRKPDIVHYFGHGTYRNGQGYLFFDDASGGASMVSATQLAAMLGDVRLVVLHACQSAMVSESGGLLTGVAPALSVVAQAVVAMQLTIRTAAATRFSEVFYDELLARRRSVQESVATARQVLFFEEDDGVSWFVPTLYIRSREQKPIYLLQ
jgi:hypothetical protein